MAFRKKILVYRDDGADTFSVACLYSQLVKSVNGAEVRFVDAKTINNDENWSKNAIAIAFPGGQDVPYNKKLGKKGTRRIKEFVEKGGSYIGICAGSYFGCEAIDWKAGDKEGFAQKRDLGFLKGTAKGPLDNLKPRYVSEFSPASVVHVDWGEDKKSTIYYHDGPRFIPDKKADNYEVLAEYSSPEKNVIAAVKCNVGKGIAVLCGVHPEITGSQIMNEGYDYVYNREVPKDLARLLKTAENSRKDFWNELLSKANIPLKNENVLNQAKIKQQTSR